METTESSEQRGSQMLRYLAMIVAAPAVIAVIFIAYFVARAEIAHDEARCPFHEIERRALDPDVTVVDEARRCQAGVAEHRWLVLREGQAREIGRRRLHDPYYESWNYRWQASLVEGSVEVDIQNGDIEPAHFREAPPK